MNMTIEHARNGIPNAKHFTALTMNIHTNDASEQMKLKIIAMNKMYITNVIIIQYSLKTCVSLEKVIMDKEQT